MAPRKETLLGSWHLESSCHREDHGPVATGWQTPWARRGILNVHFILISLLAVLEGACVLQLSAASPVSHWRILSASPCVFHSVWCDMFSKKNSEVEKTWTFNSFFITIDYRKNMISVAIYSKFYIVIILAYLGVYVFIIQRAGGREKRE